MLTDREAEALRRWYRQDRVLNEFRRMFAAEEWDELEEHLQMRCLMPLSRHSELPDWMRDDEGKTLFPTNLNPKDDLEVWQDAVEIGWAVVHEETGLTHAELMERRTNEQEADWAAFLKRAEERRRERGES